MSFIPLKIIQFSTLSILLGLTLISCSKKEKEAEEYEFNAFETPEYVISEVREPSPIVNAARKQIGVTLEYDASYVALKYPGGDIPQEKGVCTDVIIRALRISNGMDLQKLVHEDMVTAFKEYPTIWGHKTTDKNIDHRRVPNLIVFFNRKQYNVPFTEDPSDFKAGDIVTCTIGKKRPHIMIVSDRVNNKGIPYVIHNIGNGTQEEDALFQSPITGHFRIP